jgi:hypothetical protein
MTTLTGLRAATRFEARMQVRKRSLWLVLAALLAIVIATRGPKFPTQLPPGASLAQVMGAWALALNIVVPVGVGVLLADRLVRDRRLGVTNLLDSLPAGAGSRLWGKYLGTLAASAAPVVVALLAAAGYEAAHRGTAATFGWALLAFAGINLPGLAFVVAFALLVPAVISAPAFRVLFVGYWFWGNLLNPDLLPSLTGSLLTPLGDYAAAGLFGTDRLWASWPGALPYLRPHLSAGAGAASVVLLLAVGVAVMVAGQALLTRHQARA